MRIHTNTLTTGDLVDAARVARVNFTRLGDGQSRSHARFFEFTLTGESRRRQMGKLDKAATWDQWGVFLSELFSRDPNMVCGTVKSPIYRDSGDFDYKTNWRFTNDNDNPAWPTDAHGDHTFRFAGVPYQQKCTKCTAVARWQ